VAKVSRVAVEVEEEEEDVHSPIVLAPEALRARAFL